MEAAGRREGVRSQRGQGSVRGLGVGKEETFGFKFRGEFEDAGEKGDVRAHDERVEQSIERIARWREHKN